MPIHPTAIVDANANVPTDVEIGPYSVIGAGVELGSGCVLGPHVVIKGPTRIGRENRFHQFASIGDAPQDLKYKGEPTRLEIGDRNVFREGCTINRGTAQDQGITRIGNDNLFMAMSHVAHDCQIGSHCVFVNAATVGGHVHIGDWVIMAAFTGVHQFCRVGAHSFLANNAAATRDVPPYIMVEGQPAEPHSVNATGLKRRGFSADQVQNIRHAFKLLYRSGLKMSDALEQLSALVPTQPELKLLIDFLQQAPKGQGLGTWKRKAHR